MMPEKEDQELLDRLRAKYKDGGITDTLGQQDTGSAAAAAAWSSAPIVDSLAHVHLCHICQGSGVQTEVYEYRRLERTCSHCEGEGVLTTGSNAKNISQQSTSESSLAAVKPLADGSSERSSTDSAKTQKLARSVARLSRQIAAVTEEQSKLVAELTAQLSSSDSIKRSLQENLAEQLQLHLDNLKALHKSKQGELSRLASHSSFAAKANADVHEGGAAADSK